MKSYQLTEDGLFLHQNPEVYPSKPHNSVLVTPPEQDGFVARWVTNLNPISDLDFGVEGTGQWELLADNRSTVLYKTSDGTEYKLQDKTEDGLSYDGLGDIPIWLTNQIKPSQYHSWSAGNWLISEEDELKKLEDLASSVRAQRDTLIAQSDWTQLEDSPLKNNSDWIDYRQSLRDITEQSGFPENVEWPIVPN